MNNRSSILLLTLFCILAPAVILLFAATSRGDDAPSLTLTATAPPSTFGLPAAPEPTTDPPAVNAPGQETPQHDPFTPYDIGPGTHWQYKDLSPGEKAWVDKNAQPGNWQQVNDAFAQASSELAQQAAADAALHQLGITDSLAAEGVVP